MAIELDYQKYGEDILLARLTYGCQIEVLLGAKDDVAGVSLSKERFLTDSHKSPKFESVLDILFVIADREVLLSTV